MTLPFKFDGRNFRYDARDVRQFGAVAVEDGGADSTDELLDAFASGEHFDIPHGRTFLSEATLTPAASRYLLTGTGTLKLADASDTTLFYANGQTYGRISGPTFDGNKANQTVAHPLVWLRNAAYTRVRDFTVINSKGSGIKLENHNASTNADEVDIDEGHVFFSDGDGIEFAHSAHGAGTGTVTAVAGAATFSTSQAGVISDGSTVLVGATTYTVSAFNGTTLATLSGAPTFGASAFTVTTLQSLGDCVLGTRLHVNFNVGNGVHMRGGTFNKIKCQALTNDLHGILAEGDVPNSMWVFALSLEGALARNNGANGLYVHAGGVAGRGSGLKIIGGEYHFNNRSVGGSSNVDIWDHVDPAVIGAHMGDLNFAPRAAFGCQISRTTGARFDDCTFTPCATGYFASVNASTYRAHMNANLADA